MILPTEKSEKDKRWMMQKFLMMGQGKIGKSEFWAQGDRSLFIETEPGLAHLSVMKVPVRNWQEIREVGAELILLWEALKKKHGVSSKAKLTAEQCKEFPYDTVVVDTLDRLVNYSAEECVERGRNKFPKNKIDAIGDIPNGAGWFWSTSNIGNCVAKLEELPVALVLVSHVKMEEVTEPTQKYHKKTIAIGGNTGTSILHFVDHTLQIEAFRRGDEIVRKIRSKPQQELEAGSRGDIVPDGMEWGAVAKDNYAKFRKLFD